MRCILLRPKYDNITTFSHYIGEEIKEAFENHANVVNFADLSKSDATKINFLDKYNNLDKPIFIFGFGHGNNNVFLGQNNTIIFDDNDCNFYRNNIFYLFSCSCGIKLGKMIVESGGKGFIGYSGPLYLNGYYIERFKRITNEGILIAPEQNTKLKDIYDRTLQGYKEEIEKAFDEENFFLFSQLDHNKKNLVMYGEDSVKVKDFCS